jgi:scyllo-inositol 2-dehydrogenase (NADP+)
MRVAIIGLGIQGKKRRVVAGPDVVATVDPVAGGADYRTIEQVPTADYDAALVCTPDQAKLAILHYLLARGKHVLVEKPLLAATADPLHDLQERARAAGVACYTAYNHRFEPHIVRLKGLLHSGSLGTVYRCRLFYGNGTARDVRHSPWRDQGLGVVTDLGSHLLDLVLFLWGARSSEFRLWSYDRFENRACDHFVLGAAGRPALQLEGTLLSWRNTFAADVYAEHGSAHIDGLCKWGPSTFTVRRRILPSGKPPEESMTVEGPDPTWALEYEHFKDLCTRGENNLENDLWINAVLCRLARDAGAEFSS